MIRVLVADDHAVVRRGLVAILNAEPSMLVSGEASNGRDALRAVREHEYDVLVLDITMPDLGGLEVLRQIQGIRPQLPILILSVHSEEQYAARALKAGAAGYMNKESAPDELVSAINQVARGRKYVTPSLAQRLADRLGEPGAQAPHDALSNREYQVMCMLASGKTISDIAEALSLSVKTISTYRARILEKMKLENTAEIIRYAIKRGLVE